MNVTGAPWQTGFNEAVIETDAGAFGLTIIVMGFEKAGFPMGQLIFEKSRHVTTSPLTGM